MATIAPGRRRVDEVPVAFPPDRDNSERSDLRWQAVTRGLGLRALERTRPRNPKRLGCCASSAAKDAIVVVVNVWGVGRGVPGGVRKWREVASLRRFQVSLRLALRAPFRRFGDFVGTRRVTRMCYGPLVAADTCTHVVADEVEVDYPHLASL